MDRIPDKVLQAVKAAAPEARLSCADAHALAERLGVEPAVIGQAADELKIKN